MIAQVALVVVLLTGAGLLLRSYVNVLSVHTGFSASSVAVNVQLSPQYDTAQKRLTFFRAVGVVDFLPLSNSEGKTHFEAEGYPNENNQLVESRRITPDYLSAMQILLTKGRGFTDSGGPEHPSEAIVNEAFAKKYFGGRDATGHHIRMSSTSPWITIIGVVEDVRNMSLETIAEPQIYSPFGQWGADGALANSAYVVVRSLLPLDAVVSQLRIAVRSLDPNLAISDIHAMSDLQSRATANRRFQTTLLTLFSAIATFLALVGVYGLLAYSVRQRTGEIGLRMALGSSKTGVIRLVLREGLGLLGMGLLVGLAAAFAFTRLLAGFLYDVPALDPLTFALVPVLLLVATLAACLIPSWRAAAVDPMNALRRE